MRIVNRRLGRLIRDAIAVVVLAMCALSFAPARVQGGPFENFFKRVRHAMTAPAQRSSARHSSHRRVTRDEDEDRAAHTPAGEGNTRSTLRAVASKSGKADLPYGTPVAGKKGFVTSPFSPDGGYIDVRDFPPGTEVKDPYTGKTFRTP